MNVPYPSGGRRAVPFRPGKAEDVPIDQLLAELGRDIPGTSAYQMRHGVGKPDGRAQAAAQMQRKLVDDLENHPPPPGANHYHKQQAVAPHGMSNFNPPARPGDRQAPVIQPKSSNPQKPGSHPPSQPHSGRRAQNRSPPGDRPAARKPASKATDVDLLTSMANRLNALEKKMDAQRRELAEKTAECVKLKAKMNERADDSQEVRKLMDQNILLRKQRLDMEKFLADYGARSLSLSLFISLSSLSAPLAASHVVSRARHLLIAGLVWIGDDKGGGGGGKAGGSGAKLGGGGGSKSAGSSLDLVPLDSIAESLTPPAAAAAGESPVIPMDPADDAAAAAAAEKKRKEGTVEEFDMAKILGNIHELNFLAGDGAGEVVKRADGAHVLQQQDPLPVTIYRNGLLVWARASGRTVIPAAAL